ncbi:BlaI/MecI/CopY family transcriptional regulator [Prevotella disiens]|uniref:BlaI/MecI/CopY family transcriptional regulator n=1 Tax=Prevotella disiens TaxID=28130 RepID=UPI00288BD1D2|nr:BlaI/MecI/CopY family transcriptional regulator [Prevotella disiens]
MEKLTKTEEEVMLHIWHLEDCTTKEVLNELDDPKPPYTTLASVINNLKRKGFLNAKQKGLTYHYSPKIAKTEYKADFMKGFVGNYFKNSFREMVSFFAKEDKISPDELKEIIEEIEKGKA